MVWRQRQVNVECDVLGAGREEQLLFGTFAYYANNWGLEGETFSTRRGIIRGRMWEISILSQRPLMPTSNLKIGVNPFRIFSGPFSPCCLDYRYFVMDGLGSLCGKDWSPRHGQSFFLRHKFDWTTRRTMTFISMIIVLFLSRWLEALVVVAIIYICIQSLGRCSDVLDSIMDEKWTNKIPDLLAPWIWNSELFVSSCFQTRMLVMRLSEQSGNRLNANPTRMTMTLSNPNIFFVN